jgi:pimeloyl-ACP methyl ester carboxylesterase
MQFFGEHGYRCIAHDRRGHGRSTQTWDGNDMDTYADDLMTLVEALDLKHAIHVGHSTGGGEVARYIGRHGAGRAKGRVAKAVLIDAVVDSRAQSATDPRQCAESWRHENARTPGTGSPEQGQGFVDSLAGTIPLGRVADPREIAEAALFFASDASSFVNGVELFADGGAAQV